MRIYDDCYELMSEMGRNLWEMGSIVKPKTYQNKVIEGDESYITRELICEQYCLTSLNNVDKLFIYSNSKEWADNEFLERINNEPLNPGGAWTLRKDIWEQFLVNGKFDYTYSERILSFFLSHTSANMYYHLHICLIPRYKKSSTSNF